MLHLYYTTLSYFVSSPVQLGPLRPVYIYWLRVQYYSGILMNLLVPYSSSSKNTTQIRFLVPVHYLYIPSRADGYSRAQNECRTTISSGKTRGILMNLNCIRRIWTAILWQSWNAKFWIWIVNEFERLIVFEIRRTWFANIRTWIVRKRGIENSDE